MNRRGFIAGVGTIAAAGAAAPASGGPTSPAAASGRFDANADPVGIVRADPSAPGAGLTLGYIPGSAGFANAGAPRTDKLTRRGLWGLGGVRAAIAVLGCVRSAAPTIERVDLTVNFALAEPPYLAPFHAWQYVDMPGRHATASSPLRFTTSVPGAAGIVVSFRVRSPTSGATATGTLEYPIGGSGLGPGLYALAGPSPAAGGPPDWNELTWGEQPGTLARHDGRTIDFDYVTLLLSRTRSA